MLFCANCCFLALPRSNRRNLTDRTELAFYLGQITKFGVYGSSAASAASGCTDLLKGVFGAAFFWVGMGQLERAGLGCQAKNQPGSSGPREHFS